VSELRDQERRCSSAGAASSSSLLRAMLIADERAETFVLFAAGWAAGEVRAGDLPKDQVNELGIICAVWLAPTIVDIADLDHRQLFDIHRQGMAKAIRKAMRNEPSIDWLLENQDKIVHKYFQMGLDKKI